MLKKNFIISAVLAAMILAGCKKGFLDINTNPNQPTESLIEPDLTTAAQLNASARRNASGYDFLQRWMGYWSASGSYSRSTVEMSYNITNDFAAGLWDGFYYDASQFKAIQKKSNELGWTFYEGIAIIMQAHAAQNLVDIYNNVPYSTSLDLAGNIRPTYDNAEDVYKDVMAKLDEGLALIKAADINVNRNISTQDILFKGDKTKWAKFVNTLKLRLLIHASQATTFNAATEIGKINSEGSGFLGAGESASVQPGFTTDKPNPWYSAHMFNNVGAETDNYNRANNFVLNLMTTLADVRRNYFYRAPKNGGALKGTDYGSDPITANSSDNTSAPGAGIGKSATMPMWILTSVESLFLQAEAKARGWLTGDAQAAYEAAVKESFAWLGVTNADAEATAYLANPNVRIAWPAAGSVNDKVAVVIWQKYFALNGIQANETWTDFRRLGIVQPPLSLAPERGSNPIPVRLLYPSSEYNYNTDNVEGQGSISQFTSTIFWDK
jgi:hypothetical protein